MLKHEEMIENVHRRIAQYEEEQKMKHSKNIKFFSAKPDIKTEENRTNEDGYIDVVSGTDIVRPANKVLRIVSTAAAAAILVTGIGATGFLMQRNKSNNKNKSENEVYLTEATDPNLVKPIGDNSVAPFADFNQLLFSLYIINQDIEEYSDVTYNKLATFLNGFNWGEGAEIAESDIPDFDEYEGNGYSIFWKNGDLYFNVYITEDGKAYYIKTKCNPIGGAFEYPVTDSAVFNIDYDSFDKGVKDILKQNKPETGNSLSQMEIKRLSEGKFQEAELYYEMGTESEQIIPEKAETKNALSKFLEKDFLTMLKKSGSDNDSASELMYTVVRCFKTSNTTVCRESFFIYTSGFVNLCSYDLTDKDEIPTGTWNYYIDTAEFETVLNDVLSGKNDAKYADKPKHETENKNNTEKHEDVQPTTEKQEQQTTAAPDERQEQQIPENTEPATVSEENDEPEDRRDIFLSAKTGVYIWDKNDKLIASPKTHDFAALNTFSKEKLDPFLDMGMPVPTDIEAQDWAVEYNILRKYIDKDGKLKYSNYYIHKYGHMLVYYYEFENGEWWPYGSDGCGIDYAEVKAMLDEVLESSKLQKE